MQNIRSGRLLFSAGTLYDFRLTFSRTLEFSKYMHTQNISESKRQEQRALLSGDRQKGGMHGLHWNVVYVNSERYNKIFTWENYVKIELFATRIRLNCQNVSAFIYKDCLTIDLRGRQASILFNPFIMYCMCVQCTL